MRNQVNLVIGLLLIFVGLLFLAGTLFNINVWAFCWPLGLILLGVWLLVRPQLVGPDTRFMQQLLGEIKRDGDWQVENAEVWSFIGDVEMDMTQAFIPTGETALRFFCFVGDVKIYLPPDVGVMATCSAFINDIQVLDQKQDGFLNSATVTSSDFETAVRRLRIEVHSFVGDVRIRRIGAPTVDNVATLKAAEKKQ